MTPGKIHTLPRDIREELHRRMYNGEYGPKLLRWLNGAAGLKGKAAISANNLSNWKRSEHDKWVKEQQRVERIGRLSELSVRLGVAAGGRMGDGSAAIIGGKLLEEMEKIETSAPEGKELDELASAVERIKAIEQRDRALAQDDTRIAQRQQLLDQKERDLTLREDQAQKRTVEYFLKFARDPRAQAVLSSGKPQHAQAPLLREIMFGPIPDGEETKR